jgi:hypothetical protein
MSVAACPQLQEEEDVKVVITGAVVIFLVFYIMTSPDQAANIVHNGWHAASDIAHGLGDFVNKLAE